MIEVPLDRERNFMVLSAALMLQEDMEDVRQSGDCHEDIIRRRKEPARPPEYVRTIFDSQKKKLKHMATQRFQMQNIHIDPAIKPRFVRVGKDELA